MEIILLERVAKLGQMGQVVHVRDGYARNFLIPRGKALRATKAALANFETRRKELEARNFERKQEAEELAKQVEGRSVTILRQASESAQLYGSVSTRDIAEAFAASGVKFDRQQVQLEHPLKTLGVHTVVVALHPEVEVNVTVNVARSQEEAAIQAAGGEPGEAPAEEPEEVEELFPESFA